MADCFLLQEEKVLFKFRTPCKHFLGVLKSDVLLLELDSVLFAPLQDVSRSILIGFSYELSVVM